MTSSSNSPVHTDRHRRLDTSVWENSNDGQRYFNTTLRKSWKDGDQWKDSRISLGRENLLPAASLLTWADTAIGVAVDEGSKQEGNKPIASRKRGRLEAAVFQKESEERTRYAVKLRRSYKDGDEWKETAVWLSAEDLLAASQLLGRTFDHIDSIAGTGSSFVEQAKETFNAKVVEEDIPF